MKPVVWLLVAAILASTPWALAAQDSTSGTQVEGPAKEPGEAVAPAASERPPIIPARHFAERSQFNGAKLSPDGKLIAFAATVDDKATLAVFDPVTKKPLGVYPLTADAELDWFRWAGPDKIIVAVSMQGEFVNETVRFTRLALVNVAEKWIEILGRRNAVVEGDNVIFVAKDGAYALVSSQRTVYEYPSVFRYELERDGKISEVQTPRDGVWRWHADDAGVVRIGTGWRNGELRYFYREADGAKLRELTDLGEGAVKWPKGEDPKYSSISQVLSGSDRGYVMRENEAGRVGVYLFDYAKREIIEPVYENADWDVETVAMRDGRPFAAFFTSDTEQVVWFDDAQRKLNQQLDKALPEDGVWITSRAEDDSRMLVWGGGAADPGAIYIYATAEKRVEPFEELRPKLDFRQLAKPEPISFKARDGVTINGYLTLPRGREPKGLPLIVMPHGGPFWVRDTLSYNDEVQLLANRGYAVLQPNFRGSGGYGEEFHKLGSGQIGRKMQDDLDDAMDWLVDRGIADKGRACLVGGSYGGYASIWGLIRNPERWRCAASWAGVTDWARLLRYDRRFLSRNSLREWEDLVEGDQGAALDQVSPYRLAAQLGRPLLLAHGTDDSRVPFSQYKAMRDAAASSPTPPTLMVIDGEGHSFSSIDNEAKWYEALETFLAKHNPAD